MIYIRLLIISFLLISCDRRTQTAEEQIAEYIQTKKVNGKFDFNEDVYIEFANDSTSTLGVFYRINKKNREDKKIIFADLKCVEKVPAHYNEGRSEGWIYQMKYPLTVSLFSIIEDDLIYDKPIVLKNQDEYYDLVNTLFRSKTLKPSLLGDFVYQDNIEINKDRMGSKSIFYELKIKKDSIFFSGQGFQTNFYDLCTAVEQNDTLKLYHMKSLEGTDHNKNQKLPLLKLYKRGRDYYGVSPLIDEGQEVLFQKE